jgi:hypothetical protein
VLIDGPAGGKIPIIKQSSNDLSPALRELAKDFKEMYKTCLLVESTGVLPKAGGWDEQTFEFAECWLIYWSTKKELESKVGGPPNDPEREAATRGRR